MFTIFFFHLTTCITDIDIYLRRNPTQRNHRPTLTDLKKLFDKASKLKDDDPSPSRGSRKIGDAETFITNLNWTLPKYAREWRSNLDLMNLKEFSRANRLADRRGERLVVMSGLSWNVNSHHKARDFTSIVASITAETALVDSYRADLLNNCSGAFGLRKVIHNYIVSIRAPHHIPAAHPSSKTQMTSGWAFPDGLPFEIGNSDDAQYYDPDELRKTLVEVGAIVIGTKGRRDRARITINALLKNDLLMSSQPDAPRGSLETLAYHCIHALFKVPYPLF